MEILIDLAVKGYENWGLSARRADFEAGCHAVVSSAEEMALSCLQDEKSSNTV